MAKLREHIVGGAPSPLTPLLDPTLTSLARELAMDIQDAATVLQSHGISNEEYTRISQDPGWQRLLESALREWNSAFSAADRIKIKAQAMVEVSLEGLHSAINDEKVGLVARIEGLKYVSRLGGLLTEKGEVPTGRGGASGFAITINIGKETVRITQSPEELTSDAA